MSLNVVQNQHDQEPRLRFLINACTKRKEKLEKLQTISFYIEKEIKDNIRFRNKCTEFLLDPNWIGSVGDDLSETHEELAIACILLIDQYE
jgi:hypothetical protein